MLPYLRGITEPGTTSLLSFLSILPAQLLSVVAIVVLLNKIEAFTCLFDLRIDARGIELNAGGRRNVYPWKKIEKVTVRRRLLFVRGIYVYPLPGGPLPKSGGLVLSFPKLEHMTGWVFLAPIQGFKATPIEIETALARFAGPRWDPAE